MKSITVIFSYTIHQNQNIRTITAAGRILNSVNNPFFVRTADSQDYTTPDFKTAWDDVIKLPETSSGGWQQCGLLLSPEMKGTRGSRRKSFQVIANFGYTRRNV